MKVLEQLKRRWSELSEETKQNLGLFLAIPAAILFGLLLIWILPLFGQMGWSGYRLTANFTVDGHEASVSEIYRYRCTGVAAGKDVEIVPVPCQLRGEAMMVDLGQHGKVFIIMNQWNRDHTALAGHDYMVDRLSLTAQKGGRLAVNNLPAMIKFGNLNDPTTAEFVDPQNLADALGDGVTLTSFEVTTTNLSQRNADLTILLPWLKKQTASALGKQGAAAQLHAFDFKWPPN